MDCRDFMYKQLINLKLRLIHPNSIKDIHPSILDTLRSPFFESAERKDNRKHSVKRKYLARECKGFKKLLNFQDKCFSRYDRKGYSFLLFFCWWVKC